MVVTYVSVAVVILDFSVVIGYIAVIIIESIMVFGEGSIVIQSEGGGGEGEQEKEGKAEGEKALYIFHIHTS